MTAALSGLAIGLAVAAIWWLLCRSRVLDGSGMNGLFVLGFVFLCGELISLRFAVDPDFDANRGAGVYMLCYLFGIASFFLVLKYGRKLVKAR